MQYVLDRARVFGSEQQFLIGIRVLSGAIKANQAGGAYALLAERLIGHLQAATERELERAHGRVPGGAAAVIAMGKLGGREMTAASDLDLILVYDFDPDATQSSGARPLAPTQYYTRLTQRLISALSSPTAEGTLYEVDMRLRPSGQQGPVATQLSSFIALSGQGGLDVGASGADARPRRRRAAGAAGRRVEAAIRDASWQPRDRAKVAADVRDMRAAHRQGEGHRRHLGAEAGARRPGRSGVHRPVPATRERRRATQTCSARAPWRPAGLSAAGLLPAAAAEALLPAARLLNNLTQVLRLCLDGPFEPAKAPEGLKALLARAGEAPDFRHLEAELAAREGEVAGLFEALVT